MRWLFSRFSSLKYEYIPVLKFGEKTMEKIPPETIQKSGRGRCLFYRFFVQILLTHFAGSLSLYFLTYEHHHAHHFPSGILRVRDTPKHLSDQARKIINILSNTRKDWHSHLHQFFNPIIQAILHRCFVLYAHRQYSIIRSRDFLNPYKH